MHPMPHHYTIRAAAGPDGPVTVGSDDVPALATLPPPEFGGPGGHWSPESLLTAAMADCFILSFRSVADASKFAWTTLTCDVEGTLDRVERVTQFTAFRIRARLALPADADAQRAQRLLERAESVCLISNSLSAPTTLEVELAIS